MPFCVLFIIANCLIFLLLSGLFKRRLATGHARKFSFIKVATFLFACLYSTEPLGIFGSFGWPAMCSRCIPCAHPSMPSQSGNTAYVYCSVRIRFFELQPKRMSIYCGLLDEIASRNNEYDALKATIAKQMEGGPHLFGHGQPTKSSHSGPGPELRRQRNCLSQRSHRHIICRTSRIFPLF